MIMKFLGQSEFDNLFKQYSLVTHIVDHSSVSLFSVNFSSNLFTNNFDSAIIWSLQNRLSAFGNTTHRIGVLLFELSCFFE